MTDRIRLLILLARPAVVVLLGLFTAIGLAQAGQSGNHLLLAQGLAAVMGFLLFSVALNDLADEAIDRVNLPGDRRRPLVAGTATRRELVATAAGAAVVALSVSAMLHWAATVAVAAGLVLSAAYSLRPPRVADRGVVACLLLPAGYVAVPYLVGVLGTRGSIHPGDLALLGGLYAGFIGRIVLKDFRDVHGDRLFGKRTFLVRHGRRWTCAFSAACWVAGSATLAVIKQPSWMLAGAWAAQLVLALWLLRVLSFERGPRQDDAVISAIAIIGRGMLVMLLAHLTLIDAHWSALASFAVLSALAASTLGQAWTTAEPARRYRAQEAHPAILWVSPSVMRPPPLESWCRDRLYACIAVSPGRSRKGADGRPSGGRAARSG
jgi:4-hydroxybenzoate polyprenyltransferase